MTETTRKIRQGTVELDYEELSLIVHFDVETVEVDGDGRARVLDKKPESRKIKIKNLTPDKNLAQLAEQIVQSCKYLHPSRTEEVEQLLIKLRKYALANPKQENTSTEEASKKEAASSKASTKGQNSSSSRGGNERERDRDRDRDVLRDGRVKEQKVNPPDDAELLPPAHMDNLDDYLDSLYEVAGKSEKEREEGLHAQLRGTGMILKLCRDVLNLEHLIQNGTVMGALTRVLQDEYKKSMELTYNILRIFLAFSNFIEMHSLMANYRIGK